MKSLLITLVLLPLVGWNSVNGQINVDSVKTVLGDSGVVTYLDFSAAGKIDNKARLSLSYEGSIADLKTGQARPPKERVFSNSSKTLLAFNIRYAIGVFICYAIIKKDGVPSVIPNLGDDAYKLYLLKHHGQNDGSTVVEKISGNTIHFIHLNPQNQNDTWIYFPAQIDDQGKITITE